MHRHEHDAGDQTADVPAHWPPPDNDSDDAGAAVRLPDREPPRAHNAAALGITRPAAARLWFHLDEVRPVIAHATGCGRHLRTGAQAAAQAPTGPALIWAGGDTADALFSNGWPSWHDRDGGHVTATSLSWVHQPTGRRAVPGTEGRSEFFPLAVTSGNRRTRPRWSTQAADPLLHWMAIDVSIALLATGRQPQITLHESRGDLYPPDAVWQPATVACAATVGPGIYPALVAAEHANTDGGQLARFTRATINAMIHDLEVLDASDRSMPGEHAALQWRHTDLDVYEVIDTADQVVRRRVDVVRPDLDGLYPLGAHTWPWRTVAADPQSPDRG
jgi:hypothetical protein